MITDPNVATAKLKTAGLELVDHRDFVAAELCFNLAAKMFPKDRDIQFDLVRVKAWRQQLAQARKLLEVWPASDVESRELYGDISWYQSSFPAAADWYQKAIYTEPRQKASAALWIKYVKSLQAINAVKPAKAATAEALTLYPDDEELGQLQKELNKPAPAKPQSPPKPVAAPPPPPPPNNNRLWLSAFATVFRESQEQSAKSIDLNAAEKHEAYLGSIGYTRIQRHYVDSDLTDQTVRLSVGYVSRSGSEISLLAAYTPDAHFTYKSYVKLRLETPLTKRLVTGIEFGAVNYADASFFAFSPYAIYTVDPWRFTARAFVAAGKRLSVAGLADVAYTWSRYVPELYVVGGRDDASRTYLVHAEQSPFFTTGAKLTWLATERFNCVIGVERRLEQDFYQNSVTLGVIWII